jgi:hypothetical protein
MLSVGSRSVTAWITAYFHRAPRALPAADIDKSRTRDAVPAADRPWLSRRMKARAWSSISASAYIQCAWAAARKKASYLQAQFHRLRARRGAKKAIGAVAASILTAAFHMLKNGTLYEDLGPDHFDRRAQGKQVYRLINRLPNLGFAVQITPV